MTEVSGIMLMISYVSLAIGVFVGTWTLLGLSTFARGDADDYTYSRYCRLREKYPVFHQCFLMCMEMLPYSSGSSKLELIERHLPMGAKGDPWKPEEFLALVRTEGIMLSLATGIFAFMVHPVVGILCMPFIYMSYEPLRLRALVDAAENRRRRIRQRLPLAIDLIAISLGAGNTFAGSLKTVVRENKNHPISEEFGEVLRQISFGRSESDALDDLARRVADEPVDEIVFAVQKAINLGVPLANTLAEMADQIRLKAQQWGEKVSAEAQIKIIFPSIMIMVACMIVIVAPFILQFVSGEAM